MLDTAALSDRPGVVLPLIEMGGAAGAAVHVVAAFAIALFAMNAVGRGRRSVYRSAILLVLLVAMAALGAEWAIQAGAGVALWGFSSIVFGKVYKVRRRLIFSMLAILLFAALGAGWVLYPFSFFVVLRAWNLVGKHPRPTGRTTSSFESPRWSGPVDLGKYGADASTPPKVSWQEQPAILAYLQDPRLPGVARGQLQEISHRSQAAGRYLTQQGRGNALDAIEVEKIRDDYALGAVRGFLALPPWSTQDVVLVDGKTGSQLLVEQLGLLVRRLTEIQNSVAVTGGEELLTHGQFLKNRFVDGDDDQLRL